MDITKTAILMENGIRHAENLQDAVYWCVGLFFACVDCRHKTYPI
jgi:hypothetical protein